jgi:ferredoxin
MMDDATKDRLQPLPFHRSIRRRDLLRKNYIEVFMEIDITNLIYFSPTGTTRRVINGILAGLLPTKTVDIDLTAPQRRQALPITLRPGPAIIGVPVYSGRVAPPAAAAIHSLQGGGQPAVLVVVYGNRKYEDALLELQDLTRDAGFVPVAGGAFIGEHSYANGTFPIAWGRPDDQDLAQARRFGTQVRVKLEGLQDPAQTPLLALPGNVPYRQPKIIMGIAPISREAHCTLCGTCAEVCPTAAIAVGNRVETDIEACILCCACVKNCPSDARVMAHPEVLRVAGWLSENFPQRQEPEWYL